jgi:hypothetical protein
MHAISKEEISNINTERKHTSRTILWKLRLPLYHISIIIAFHTQTKQDSANPTVPSTATNTVSQQEMQEYDATKRDGNRKS